MLNSIGENADADGISEGLAIGQNADGADGRWTDGRWADGRWADGRSDLKADAPAAGPHCQSLMLNANVERQCWVLMLNANVECR